MGWRGSFPLFFILMAVAFVAVAVLKVEKPRWTNRRSQGSLALLGQPISSSPCLEFFSMSRRSLHGPFPVSVYEELCLAHGATEDEAIKTASKFGPALFFGLLTIGRI